MINVLNKRDLVEENKELEASINGIKDSVAISALKGENLDKLKDLIEEKLGDKVKQVTLRLPYEKAEILDWLYQNGEVTSEEYRDSEIRVEGKIEQHLLSEMSFKLDDDQLEIIN